MKKRAPSGTREIVHIAEAAERRREKVIRENLRAIADATEALAGEPDAASNFTMLGNMALIEHAFEEAIEAYSRALLLAPDDVNARAGRARAYAALGEYDLALADVDRALSLAPDEAKLHYLRGRCLSEAVTPRWNVRTEEWEFEDDEQVRCEAALISLEKALELAVKDGKLYEDILFALVGTRETMRDEEACLAMLDRALRCMPDDVVLLALRESRRRRRGDRDGAGE